MTHGNSREVESAQGGVHPRLDAVVRTHARTPWREPCGAPTAAAIAALQAAIGDALGGRATGETGGARPHDARATTAPAARVATPGLVLDSGCGTGASTALLAAQHRDAIVVGIDRSLVRLRARLPGDDAVIARDGNAVWLRADAAQAWRALAQRGVRVARHYLLYPNPWPKAAHLRRRWHAHPAWPSLLALGGVLEMRCNWRVYADEFARALAVSGYDARIESLSVDGEALSPFERKYRASGHALWRVRVDLDAR